VPAAVAVFGQVLSTNGGGGTYSVDISPIGAMSALNSKAQPGGTNGQIQYNNNGAFGGISTNGTGNVVLTTGAQIGGVFGTGRPGVTPSDTLAAADCGTQITYNSGSPITLTTVTAPVSGTKTCAIAIQQEGAGVVTIADGASATHHSLSCPLGTTAGLYAIMSLSVQSANPSEWIIGGQGL
jgi:hypothetical protein